MSTATQNGLQAPGEVAIEELILVANGKFIPLNDYLVELNIFESIFNNSMSGDILLSDSRNLVRFLPIIGEEYLIVKLQTPTLNSQIYKTFRVVSVEDRTVVRDQNTQLYKLKFISQEALVDSLSPLYSPFNDNASTLVEKIFSENIEINRNLKYNLTEKFSQSQETTSIVVYSRTANNIKFVSPGWTPFECINWIARKSLPSSGRACNFLFWETAKAFYFGAIEDLFDKGQTIGKYNYSATSVTRGTDDIEEQMTLIQNLDILNGLDHLTSLDNGYFASTLIAVDLIKKKRDITEYDHVTEFNNYKHVVAQNPQPLFTPNNVLRNFESHIRVYPKHPGLHDNNKDNYTEKMGAIYGNRLSNLHDLNTLKLNISIYGRTDVEAGRLMEINFPDISPASSEDKTSEHLDNRYSGTYLITSIHHKINLVKHMMSMEVIRDSMQPDTPKFTSTFSPQGY
jgi:hypothetical protein